MLIGLTSFWPHSSRDAEIVSAFLTLAAIFYGDLAVAALLAHELRVPGLLVGPTEEGPAAEAGHPAVVDLVRLVAGLATDRADVLLVAHGQPGSELPTSGQLQESILRLDTSSSQNSKTLLSQVFFIRFITDCIAHFQRTRPRARDRRGPPLDLDGTGPDCHRHVTTTVWVKQDARAALIADFFSPDADDSKDEKHFRRRETEKETVRSCSCRVESTSH